MSNTLKHKSSSAQGNTPSTGDLILGEIAVNTYDGKVYIKKDDGSESIVEIGAGTSNQVPVGQGIVNVWEYTSTQGQTVFTGADNNTNTLDINGTNITVYVNGFNLTPNEFSYTSDTLTLTSGVDINIPVIVYNYILNGPGIGTKSSLPAASLKLFNTIIFEVGNKPYICTANSDAPALDSDCFWVSLT